MKLTWNQTRALERLLLCGFEGTSRQVSEAPGQGFQYLCGSAARSALKSLERKGLVERIPGPPFRYRITPAGRQALEHQQ